MPEELLLANHELQIDSVCHMIFQDYSQWRQKGLENRVHLSINVLLANMSKHVWILVSQSVEKHMNLSDTLWWINQV